MNAVEEFSYLHLLFKNILRHIFKKISFFPTHNSNIKHSFIFLVDYYLLH